ncbi:hypothetical protein Dimus_037336 [Dionaea muscipula]
MRDPRRFSLEGEVHDSSDIRAEVRSTPEDVGIMRADEEDERIENEIARICVQSVMDWGIENIDDPRKEKEMLEWRPKKTGNAHRSNSTRIESPPRRGGARSLVSSKKGESSGSRFYVLEGTDGEGGCSRQMREIEAAVSKQLGYILASLPIPEI